MQGTVELAISAAVEAVAGGEPRGGGDRGDPGEARERGFVSDAAGVGSGAEHGGSHDRADTALVEQVRPP